MSLLQELVRQNAPNLGTESLLKILLNLANVQDIPRHVLSNVAKAVAAVVTSSSPDLQRRIVQDFIRTAQTSEHFPVTTKKKPFLLFFFFLQPWFFLCSPNIWHCIHWEKLAVKLI